METSTWFRSALLATAVALTPACLGDEPDPLPPEQSDRVAEHLALGHALPKVIVERTAHHARRARDLLALAKRLGGMDRRAPVTHGTLTESTSGTIYSPRPADRLIVERLRMPRMTLVTNAVVGDLDAPVGDFFDNEHILDVAIVVDGGPQVRVTSERDAAGELRTSIRGSDTYQGIRYELAVAGVGSHTQTNTPTQVTRVTEQRFTGTITSDASGVHIDVDETWSSELITSTSVAFWASAYHMRVIDNRMRAGDDELRWMSATLEKAYQNGRPVAYEETWSAEGSVLLNGAELARYTFEMPDDIGIAPRQPGFFLLLADDRLPVD